jgi:3-deoxy-manno-octulosonate cytidylyltransferase (CMP-KDO synthetase)
MRTVGIIPARLKSERLANKVLKPISDKPLIWYVWQKAKNARILDRVIIACCDDEVKEKALSFGAEVFLTSPEHKSGTDRIAEVASKIDCDVVLNIQADEPLIKSETLDKLAIFLVDNPNQVMASIAFVTTKQRQLEDPNVVKVVVDKLGNALYFSRRLIPYNFQNNLEVKYLKHIGLYGYRRNFLLEFTKMKQTYLEKVEKLEQLRALEHSINIKILEIDYDTIGVDTEEDFKRVEKILKRK